MSKNISMGCLRTFVAINESGTFAGAAKQVGRTTSAVSLQIKRLEEQLAVQLYRRSVSPRG